MTGFIEKTNFAKHSKKSTSQVKFDCCSNETQVLITRAISTKASRRIVPEAKSTF